MYGKRGEDMEIARMTSKGQLTIPVSVRRKLGISTGDQLLFYEKNGQMVIAKETPAALGDAQIAALENHIYSLEEIRQITIPITGKYKVGKVRLFGSYARNEATAESDIDLLIDRCENQSFFTLAGMQAELADAFHKKVDLLTEDSLKPEFLKEIQKDEVTIFDSTTA